MSCVTVICHRIKVDINVVSESNGQWGCLRGKHVLRPTYNHVNACDEAKTLSYATSKPTIQTLKNNTHYLRIQKI